MVVMIMNNKAYEYCKKSIKLKTTPKYVKLQMKDFIKICDGKDKKYMLSKPKLDQLNKILKILSASNLRLWLIIANFILFCKHKRYARHRDQLTRPWYNNYICQQSQL